MNADFIVIYDSTIIFSMEHVKHYYVGVTTTDFSVTNDGIHHIHYAPTVRFGALLGDVFGYAYATLHYFCDDHVADANGICCDDADGSAV